MTHISPVSRDAAPPAPPDPHASRDVWACDDDGWLDHPQERLELAAVLRALGRSTAPAGGGAPAHRAAVLENLTTTGVQVPPTPIVVDGVVDGIQRTLSLRRREHRPITLAYIAAASARGQALTAIAERVCVICSHRDLKWVRSAAPTVPVVVLEEHHPANVEAATARVVDLHRRVAERRVVERAAPRDGGLLLVDGPVRQYGTRLRLGGVVKSLGDQLWVPASLLPARAGDRSPAFLIPSGTRSESDVHSAYLRLHDCPPEYPATHGLIRLEVQERADLDALAAFCLASRQGPGSGDPRWPVHLAPVRLLETVLGARVPLALKLRG